MSASEHLSTTAQKRDLRAQAIAARSRLSPLERAQASRRAAERLLALPAFTSARTVALYASMGAEMDTGEIVRSALAAGKTVAYPRVVPGERRLVFASCLLDELVPGPLGTREPPASAPRVPFSSIDLIITPGVAFDERGRRLGRGGGYYDAALSELPASASCIALAFDVQIVPAVPDEPHDARLDMVVTERRILRAGPDSP